jgi:hypothetical protein
VQHDQPTTTVAILGSDTVVGRTLCVLLEGHGYQTTLLDSYPTGIVDELLEGAHLLILTPRVDQGVREAFIGAIGKSQPQKERLPVISLSTMTTKESTEGEEGDLSVPWPCSIEDLVDHIETALSIQTASTTQQEEVISNCHSRVSGNPPPRRR